MRATPPQKDIDPMRYLQRLSILLATLTFSASLAEAQSIFSSELDSDAGWTIVADSDTAYEFGFDYTTLGIPANPNSSAGTTTGLKMSANIADGAGAAISATPDGVNASGSYRLETDFWLNYNTSGGTTEFIGAFVGYDASGSAINGIGILGDSDGDSGSDYRFYNDAQIAARNNSEAEIAAFFPGQTVPAAQGDAALFLASQRDRYSSRWNAWICLAHSCNQCGWKLRHGRTLY